MTDLKKWHKDRIDEVLSEHKYGILIGIYIIGFAVWMIDLGIKQSFDKSGFAISICFGVYGVCYTVQEAVQYARTKKRRERRCGAGDI